MPGPGSSQPVRGAPSFSARRVYRCAAFTGLLASGETTARVSGLGECTAEYQGLAHPGRRAQHREPMAGLDGMDQPRDGLVVARHMDIRPTAVDKGITVQSPMLDPAHARPFSRKRCRPDRTR